MSTPIINSIYFTPKFDITKDLVITLDYATNVPFTVSNGLSSCAAVGGFAICLFDNSLSATPTGGGSVSLFGTDITNGLVNVFFDFDGGVSGIANSVSIFGPSPAYPQLSSMYQTLTAEFIGSNVPARIQVRFTDFGNTIIVNQYDFVNQVFYTLNTGSWVAPFYGVTQVPLSAAGVLINYAYTNTGTTQTMTISNININGQFTSDYIALSTILPS